MSANVSTSSVATAASTAATPANCLPLLNLDNALAALKPGKPNCVMSCAVLPAVLSTSGLNSSKNAFTSSVTFVSNRRSIPVVGNVARPCGIETTPAPMPLPISPIREPDDPPDAFLF